MLESIQHKIYDLLIIGGGINGTGIANDASGRGLSVFLCEQFDLANETSSRSTKMIHGGLRYLEYYEFRLVREALHERDVLLNIAPHIVQPLQLIIPHNKLQRPAWLIRLGLFLYDHLGMRLKQRSKIPSSYVLSLNDEALYSRPLKSELKKAFCYYDCKTDDSRLVVFNALAAQKNGATIRTRCQFIEAKRQDNLWHCSLIDQKTQQPFTIICKALINASGPWVDDVVNRRLEIRTHYQVELVKGSHIVLPKLYDGEHAYMLQNSDKRIIFIIPYREHFTMIGTTDVAYQGAPNLVEISETEREYLCNSVNHYFKKSISPADIVYEWSGVRPLQADDSHNPSAISRDYKLEIEDQKGQTPILSIFGGKITTYRRLAEHALEKLKLFFPHMGPAWTATKPLPGGDILSPDALIQELIKYYPFLSATLLKRYAHSYGSISYNILDDIMTIEDMGINFGAQLYAIEVDYLVQHEWAQTVEDILWRRSKLGLEKVDIASLEQHLLNGISTAYPVIKSILKPPS